MRIAFDLDGTLIASILHIHHAVSLALKEMSLEEIDVETLEGFVGNGLPKLIQRSLTHLKQDQALHAELTRRAMVHYTSLPSDPASVYPGVSDALSALRAAGHHLAVCTNKPFQATLSALTDTGLIGHFDLIIAGDSFSTNKPDPEMLWACKPDLFVGDSEIDAATSRAADIPFLLFTEGYRKTAVADIPHRAAFAEWKNIHSLL